MSFNEIEKSQKLYLLAQRVKSGDSDNLEATAASLYFKVLFGEKFTRGADNSINSNLNYGYAIIRSTIAKNLVAFGFEPSLGIFHHSELNNFNLADDLIEPFRPVIDLYVAQNISPDDMFGTEQKANLLNLLNADVVIDNNKYAVSYAVELVVKSFSTALKAGIVDIKLPEIIPLKMHEYE